MREVLNGTIIDPETKSGKPVIIKNPSAGGPCARSVGGWGCGCI